MPYFYQRRLEGTPLNLPIANETYVSIVKLKNRSAQKSLSPIQYWAIETLAMLKLDYLCPYLNLS